MSLDFFDAMQGAKEKPRKQILFKGGEEVTLGIIGVEEAKKYDSIKLECKILSGEHEGSNYDIYIPQPKTGETVAGMVEGDKAQKSRASVMAEFYTTFWSKEQLSEAPKLENGTPFVEFTPLIGRRFKATASTPYTKGSKTYQSLREWSPVTGDGIPF